MVFLTFLAIPTEIEVFRAYKSGLRESRSEPLPLKNPLQIWTAFVKHYNHWLVDQYSAYAPFSQNRVNESWHSEKFEWSTVEEESPSSHANEKHITLTSTANIQVTTQENWMPLRQHIRAILSGSPDARHVFDAKDSQSAEQDLFSLVFGLPQRDREKRLQDVIRLVLTQIRFWDIPMKNKFSILAFGNKSTWQSQDLYGLLAVNIAASPTEFESLKTLEVQTGLFARLSRHERDVLTKILTLLWEGTAQETSDEENVQLRIQESQDVSEKKAASDGARTSSDDTSRLPHRTFRGRNMGPTNATTHISAAPFGSNGPQIVAVDYPQVETDHIIDRAFAVFREWELRSTLALITMIDCIVLNLLLLLTWLIDCKGWEIKATGESNEEEWRQEQFERACTEALRMSGGQIRQIDLSQRGELRLVKETDSGLASANKDCPVAPPSKSQRTAETIVGKHGNADQTMSNKIRRSHAVNKGELGRITQDIENEEEVTKWQMKDHPEKTTAEPKPSDHSLMNLRDYKHKAYKNLASFDRPASREKKWHRPRTLREILHGKKPGEFDNDAFPNPLSVDKEFANIRTSSFEGSLV